MVIQVLHSLTEIQFSHLWEEQIIVTSKWYNYFLLSPIACLWSFPMALLYNLCYFKFLRIWLYTCLFFFHLISGDFQIVFFLMFHLNSRPELLSPSYLILTEEEPFIKKFLPSISPKIWSYVSFLIY
jgi:hypothetical protein